MRQTEEILTSFEEARYDTEVCIKEVFKQFYPEALQDPIAYHGVLSSVKRHKRELLKETDSEGRPRFPIPDWYKQKREKEEERIRREHRERQHPKPKDFQGQYVLGI